MRIGSFYWRPLEEDEFCRAKRKIRLYLLNRAGFKKIMKTNLVISKILFSNYLIY